jgi:hypothetical protein
MIQQQSLVAMFRPERKLDGFFMVLRWAGRDLHLFIAGAACVDPQI